MKVNKLPKLISGIAVVVLAASMLTGCKEDGKAQPAIKFVDMEQVLVKSGLHEKEQAHLKDVLAQLEKGLELAQSQYGSLPEDKVEAARRSDSQILQAQWQNEQVSARNAIIKAVTDTAKQYQEENKLEAILPSQSTLAISKDADITDALSERLSKVTVSFNKLPEISIKTAEDAPKVEEKAAEPKAEVKTEEKVEEKTPETAQ